jgi:hypothetical protein
MLDFPGDNTLDAFEHHFSRYSRIKNQRVRIRALGVAACPMMSPFSLDI